MSKQFDKQFKENAVQYYLVHKDHGWKKCAENLGISRNAIQSWVKAAAENAGEVPARGSENYASDDFKAVRVIGCMTIASWKGGARHAA